MGNSSEYFRLSHNVSNLVYHFVSTVGKNQNETVIQEYVRNQGKQDCEYYKQIYLNLR